MINRLMFLALYPVALLKNKKLIGAGLFLLLLTACGGSGGSSGGSDGHTAGTLSGTAYIGDEAEGTVYVKDIYGRTAQAEISADGSYSVNLESLNAPFLLKGELRNKVSKYQPHILLFRRRRRARTPQPADASGGRQCIGGEQAWIPCSTRQMPSLYRI